VEVSSTGSLIPIVGVADLALFAVEVGVNGHAFVSFQRVDKVVGAGPVAFRVPPEGGEGDGEASGRVFRCQGCAEVVGVHGTFVAKLPGGGNGQIEQLM